MVGRKKIIFVDKDWYFQERFRIPGPFCLWDIRFCVYGVGQQKIYFCGKELVFSLSNSDINWLHIHLKKPYKGFNFQF